MSGEGNHRCALCGYTFDATGLACHTACPMSSGCNIVCCPNCGYQVPDEYRMGITGALKRAWDARTAKKQMEREA